MTIRSSMARRCRRVLLPILLLATVAIAAVRGRRMGADQEKVRDGQTFVADIRSGKA